MGRLGIDGFITFLTVADLNASHAFYGGALGLPLVLDQGPCRIYRTTPSAYLGICTHREDVRPEGVIVTLLTDQVDEWCEALIAKGTTIEDGPRLNERFNIYHAFLRDPDGHLVEIQQFVDPRWAGPPNAADLLQSAQARIERWEPGEALREQESGATLVDVRDTGDMRRYGRIAGALEIPLSTLEWRADPDSPFRNEVLASSSGRMILICNDGYSSSLAAARLRNLGRTAVGDVIGGFHAWVAAGLPVEKDA